MDDRELLELAAKAAGIPVTPDCHIPTGGICLAHIDVDQVWSPLHDDGDAFRLLNKLRLCLGHTLFCSPDAHGTAMVGYEAFGYNAAPIAFERYHGPAGQNAATRRAIVRAAAEIGKSIQDVQQDPAD